MTSTSRLKLESDFAGLDARRAASVLQAKGITNNRRYLPGLGRVSCYIIHRDSLED
ncbi:hypothetical protein J5664_00320 [Escherichia coli]|nr:hypothetical protein [Escherichia coli]